MLAKNIYGETIDEIKSKYAKAIEDGFAPTLAIVFSSITRDRKSIVDFFSEKNVTVFGSTTAGEIIDDEVLEHSSVIMLLDMNKENFKILHEEGSDTYSIASSLAKSKGNF